jgi:hypothetical protein
MRDNLFRAVNRAPYVIRRLYDTGLIAAPLCSGNTDRKMLDVRPMPLKALWVNCTWCHGLHNHRGREHGEL